MAGKGKPGPERKYPVLRRFAVYDRGKEDAYKPVKSFKDVADAIAFVAIMKTVHNRSMVIRHQEQRRVGGWTVIENDAESIKPTTSTKPPNR